LSQARADGKPDFSIRQLTPNSDERYVIQYIEPLDRNLLAVGLDIGSEQHRRAAADTAINTGEVQLTAPITLVQATGNPQQSFLILLPIYESWATPATKQERWQHAIGWTYAPLLMEEILNSLNVDTTRFHLVLTDIGTPDTPIRFYDTDLSITPEENFFPQRLERQVFGRKWQIDVSAKPGFIKNLPQTNPLYLFSIGSIISVLFSLLAIALSISVREKQKSR
jgi:CHASE1-domain containing sensor protein